MTVTTSPSNSKAQNEIPLKTIKSNGGPTGDESVRKQDEEDSADSGMAWPVGSIILVNALVGAGILNFPASIHAAGGLLTAIFVQLIIVLLLWAAISGMVWCSSLSNTTLYQDTVNEYLGAPGRYICSVIMLLYCVLITTTYLIAIGQQLSAGAQILFGTTESHWYTSQTLLVFIGGICIILPFCLVRHIDKLHYASGVASLSVILVAMIVIFEYYEEDHGKVIIRTRPNRWTEVFLSVPAYTVAYMFDLCSVAVYGRLKQRSVLTYAKSSGLALLFVICFYNTFAGFAYSTFGSNIHSNFMTNYRDRTWIIAAAQFAYSLKLCLEYPIYQFLGWTALKTLVGSLCAESCSACLEEEKKSLDRFRLGTSLLWLALTICVALFATDISYVLPLASAAVVHFQFTFPGLCIIEAAFQLQDSISGRKCLALKLCAVFFVAFGVGISGIMIGQYIYQTTDSAII